VTFADFVNNVVYGWAGNYGTRIRNGSSANVIRNYYVPDDGSDISDALIIDASAGPVYLEGNILPPSCPAEGTIGAMLEAPPVTEMDPEEALAAVLAEAGAFPRDDDDEDYANQVSSSPVQSTSWGSIKAMYR
ncbi:hypothetical protein K8S17_06105, partial [bacterium]|nr:hypothetical protein [bacterium]